MNDPAIPGLGRRVVASAWAAAAMPYLVLSLWAPLARGLGVFESVPIPLLAVLSAIAGVLLVFGVPRLATPLPASLDCWLDPEHRKLAALWAVGSLLAVFVIGRIAIFLADPRLVEFSIAPDVPFLVQHSCLTAYMHGAILSMDPTANVYDMAYVPDAADLGKPVPATAQHFAPFTLDAYGYPPPFLLWARALLLVSSEFLSQRLWFGAASLLLMLFACAAAANTLGGVAERRIWLLTPIFVGSPLVLGTLQVGNFHVAAVALCLLCWVALERHRDGVAGTLLAVATLAKIFPGLLGVLLLVQRRWRAVGYTCLAATIICGLSVAVLGTKVWSDFLFYHLPHVQSGEALAFLAATPREIAFNHAPFGIPFKLQALGLTSWGWAEARLLGHVYTVLLFVLAVLAGRNKGSPQHRATVWMAIVMLASLRSPYAAPFVLSTMSLVLLMLVAEVRSRSHLAAFVAVSIVIVSPTPPSDPAVEITWSLVRIAVLYGFCGWLVLRKTTASIVPTSVVPPASSSTDSST
jgi:alpha-1,2-mannosyltransferase